MINLKKIFLCAMSFMLVLCCFNACNTGTYAVKRSGFFSGGVSVSPEEYVFYLFIKYEEALSKFENEAPDGDVFSKKIGDKAVSQWMKDETYKQCGRAIYAREQFSKLKLSLDETEEKDLKQEVEDQWKECGDAYAILGTNKEAVMNVQSDFLKLQRVFEALYGNDGAKAPSNEQFMERCVQLSYVAKDLTPKEQTSEDGVPAAAPDSEKIDKAQKELEECVVKIENNEKTFDEIATEIAGDKKGRLFKQSAQLPISVLEDSPPLGVVKDMRVGELRVVSLNSSGVVLPMIIRKEEFDSEKFKHEQLDDAERKKKLLRSLFLEDFYSYIESVVNLRANEDVLKKFSPDFIKESYVKMAEKINELQKNKSEENQQEQKDQEQAQQKQGDGQDGTQQMQEQKQDQSEGEGDVEKEVSDSEEEG
ncbi:MAG: hypothetical protein LBF33_02295 [Oscillospiraceae bacterium]|jgi:hypothetical protein|nr:hypothetical protein [Oscillospiraceae bacterium]